MEKALKNLKSKLSQSHWFFDYDGSLCPHLEVWDDHNYDTGEILNLLKALSKKSSEVLWNTGRRPESLFGVLAEFSAFSGYFIQGSLFWNGTKSERELLSSAVPSEILVATEKMMQDFGSDYKLEIKPTSLRVAPARSHLNTQLKVIVKTLSEMPISKEWRWHFGHRGAELLKEGFNKGTALADFYKSRSKDGIPVAIGDDLLDRAAFEYALENNGFAFVVGESAGWITQIPHKPDQVIFCESPEALHQKIDQLL